MLVEGKILEPLARGGVGQAIKAILIGDKFHILAGTLAPQSAGQKVRPFLVGCSEKACACSGIAID